MAAAGGKRRRLARTVKAVAVLAAAVVATEIWVAELARVSGASMEPALSSGDRVVFEKTVMMGGGPKRFDVVVFKAPNDPDTIYIKRVMGLPDEVVEMKGGRLLVDGMEVRTPEGVRTEGVEFGPAAVSPAHYFVMGDNAGESVDSRQWGGVPRDYVLGRVWLRYWPIEEWKVFRRESAELTGARDADQGI